MLLGPVGQYMFCEVGTEVPESLAGNVTARGGSSPKQPGPQLPVVTAWQAVVVELVWHDCCPAGQLSGAPHLQHISNGCMHAYSHLPNLWNAQTLTSAAYLGCLLLVWHDCCPAGQLSGAVHLLSP